MTAILKACQESVLTGIFSLEIVAMAAAAPEAVESTPYCAGKCGYSENPDLRWLKPCFDGQKCENFRLLAEMTNAWQYVG
ncbi:MAG: hypothetical protein WBH28_25550 [Fuerstiella sp.]